MENIRIKIERKAAGMGGADAESGKPSLKRRKSQVAETMTQIAAVEFPEVHELPVHDTCDEVRAEFN